MPASFRDIIPMRLPAYFGKTLILWEKAMEQINRAELVNPRFSKKGYIQVYTGDGKGKTTASLGLTLRALGRGWKVLLVMFTKGGDDYGELYAFKKHFTFDDHLEIVQAGLNRIIYSFNTTENDTVEITNGWEIAKKAILNNHFDLVILDEANIAIDLGLIDIDEFVSVLGKKPTSMEVVITGRRAHHKIVDVAHLVSEITPKKHYWDIGVEAREGIEY